MTAPDLPDELDRWEPESLAAGFTIEGARVDADLSGVAATGGRFEQCELDGTLLTGSRLRSITMIDVVFRDCKLDLASFQLGRIRRAAFEGCVLAEADLSGATVIDTRFGGSELRSVEVAEVKLTRVDLRGSQLEEPRGGVTSLRGAIVDPVQLVGLAPMLAHGLGIVVAE